jgi:hypothetical protein
MTTTEHVMATPEDVADKVAKKAAETLSPLQLEMDMRRWPPEFRKIMWDAVAQHAAILANEAK